MESTCRTAAGFLLCGGTQLNRGYGGICAVYKLLDRLPAVRNISNKIIVLEKE